MDGYYIHAIIGEKTTFQLLQLSRERLPKYFIDSSVFSIIFLRTRNVQENEL